MCSSVKITLPKVVYACTVFCRYKFPGFKIFPMSDVRFVAVLAFIDFWSPFEPHLNNVMFSPLTWLSNLNSCHALQVYMEMQSEYSNIINPLNAELNPICHLLALLGAHHILHISRIRVKIYNLILFKDHVSSHLQGNIENFYNVLYLFNWQPRSYCWSISIMSTEKLFSLLVGSE